MSSNSDVMKLPSHEAIILFSSPSNNGIVKTLEALSRFQRDNIYQLHFC
jgi:hypothetical protein